MILFQFYRRGNQTAEWLKHLPELPGASVLLFLSRRVHNCSSRKSPYTSFLANSLLSFIPQLRHHLFQEILPAVTPTLCPPSDLDALPLRYPRSSPYLLCILTDDALACKEIKGTSLPHLILSSINICPIKERREMEPSQSSRESFSWDVAPSWLHLEAKQKPQPLPETNANKRGSSQEPSISAARGHQKFKPVGF